MELPIFKPYINFSRHHLCCFTIAPLFVLDKYTAWNRCLQHPYLNFLCKIAQAFNNSNSNAQHFLSDLLTHSWFHSMFFALPSYQFPYNVMNRSFYLISQNPTCHFKKISILAPKCRTYLRHVVVLDLQDACHMKWCYVGGKNSCIFSAFIWDITLLSIFFCHY
jgi:hypothetical protein